MDILDYCIYCRESLRCEYYIIPCMHTICKNCMIVGHEYCPMCDKGIPDKFVKREDILEKGSYNHDMEIERYKEYMKKTEIDVDEAMKKIMDIEDEYEREIDKLVKERDEKLRDFNIEIEKKQQQHELFECMKKFHEINGILGLRPITYFDEISKNMRYYSNDFKHSKSFGKYGEENGEFQRPLDIMVNSKGQLLINDSFNKRIQIFDENMNFVKSVGSDNSSDDKFWRSCDPMSMSIDEKDNIYVSNLNNYVIRVYDSCGKKVLKFVNMNSPYIIYVNKNNQDILVIKMEQNIIIFNNDFNCIRMFGNKGIEKGQLKDVIGMVVNSKNEIIVSESENNRLQVFDYQGNHLRFIGYKKNQLMMPHGLSIDENDNIFVGSQKTNFPITMFDKNGNHINSFGIKGCCRMNNVYYNKNNKTLYVSDTYNHCIHIFERQ